MKALQFTSNQNVEQDPLTVHDVAIPPIGEDEILIRVHTCGLCHTDLHIIEGELPLKRSPLTPGHQIVGIIEKMGGKVKKHKVGDRVGVPWLYSTCGECYFCKKGNENLCEKALFTGYDVDGGLAEYVAAKEDFAYLIPKGFSDETAAPLLCAGIIGFRALRLSNINPGERLGLYGFGASAHIALQVARHWGCEVYVFSRNGDHRAHAEQLGAGWTGTADDVPPHSIDSAISFAPAGELVPKALRVLRKGGTLALAGIYMTPIPPLEYSLLYHERIVRSVANSTRKDAIDFLRIAAEIPVKTDIELFTFNEVSRALRLLKASKIRGAGVVKIL